MINKQEIRIVAALGSIFALRMLGLCMLLPVFAIEALNYTHANAQLIGLAVAVYGLAQAILQLPFGILSDKYGRKPLIVVGLGFIVLGSLISAWTQNIYGLILGRLLQGCGAIGSVVIATMADHVRAEVRTTAMAILGIGIGLSFAIALVIGPWLNQSLGLPGIFGITAVLAVLCGCLLMIIPNNSNWQPAIRKNSLQAMRDSFTPQLFKVNFGVFALHANLAALFLVLPGLLLDAGVVSNKLWQFYCLAIIASMLVAWRLIAYGERRQNIENLQLVAILGLLFAESILYKVDSWLGIAGSLVVFFSAFCVLEASLPALVSKYAAADNRGAALGMYSGLQFLGIFVGGMAGGWLHGYYGSAAVLSFCISLVLGWLFLTINFKGKSWQEV